MAKPVVTTASGGPLEIVKEGEAGLLVPVGDTAAMAHALLTLLADRIWASALGMSGQNIVDRFFQIERTISQIQEACEGVLADARQ